VALCDLALAQEAAGKPQESAQTAQHFLDTYPDHYLAPQAHACLARSLAASGQAEQAKTALQKISLQYPGTSWADWAAAKLKGS
jgi:TolA-binding protein